MIGAVNCCWVWYKLPEGMKAAWSLGQAYYYHHYSGGPTEIMILQTELAQLHYHLFEKGYLLVHKHVVILTGY